jgi:hypothetical protein
MYYLPGCRARSGDINVLTSSTSSLIFFGLFWWGRISSFIFVFFFIWCPRGHCQPSNIDRRSQGVFFPIHVPSPFCGLKYPCQVLVEERSKVNPIVSDVSEAQLFFPFYVRNKIAMSQGKQLFTLFFTAALDSPSFRSITALKNGISR